MRRTRTMLCGRRGRRRRRAEAVCLHEQAVLAETALDAVVAADRARRQRTGELAEAVGDRRQRARGARAGLGYDERQLAEPVLAHARIFEHLAEVVEYDPDMLPRDLGELLERQFAATRRADAVDEHVEARAPVQLR